MDVNKDGHYFINCELISNGTSSIELVLHLLLGLATAGVYMLTFRQSSEPAPPASPSVRHIKRMNASLRSTTTYGQYQEN